MRKLKGTSQSNYILQVTSNKHEGIKLQGLCVHVHTSIIVEAVEMVERLYKGGVTLFRKQDNKIS